MRTDFPGRGGQAARLKQGGWGVGGGHSPLARLGPEPAGSQPRGEGADTGPPGGQGGRPGPFSPLPVGLRFCADL